MHAPVRSTFATTDPEEAVTLVAEAYGSNRLRVRGDVGNFQMAQSRVDLGTIRLDEYSNSLVTEYTFEPLSSLNVVRVRGRAVEYRTSHTTSLGGPGDVLLATQPGEAYDAKVDGAQLQVIGVDPSLLDQVADALPAESVRRFSREPLAPDAARSWQRSVDYLTDTVLTDELAATSPLILGAAGRLLASTLLTAFDTGAAGSRPGDRTDATPDAVRRAVAYMEGNTHRNIGVADIARASYVGVRALQLAFRRHLDTTPMAHLRRLRLDRARADLLDADPGHTTVTVVATRWGWGQPSRFAADYRAAYGRLPSQDLQR